jgi:hypothetical protein
MIRREIELPDTGKTWLLVSQVDHAHVSGELTKHWNEEFPSEVVEAISHHDDGWAIWEAEPRLHPETGAPYSFLEMPLADSLMIWDQSIASARKYGLLAGYVVAGHFYNLLSDSANGGEPMAIAWLTAKRKVRTAWLDEWVRADATHTIDDAKRAQQMLLLSDLFSLWLCCDCPIAGEPGNILPQSDMKSRAHSLLGQFGFAVPGFGRRHPTPENATEAFAWVVEVEPYPFQISPLTLSAPAIWAPASHYSTWQELVAGGRRIELRWRLIPAGESTPETRPTLSTGDESR